MDHAGVFQSSSFMAPDTLAVTIQAVALALALVSTYRLLLRLRHTTNLVVHLMTMLAMLFCSLFAWLTFGYLFFRHKLETCIVRVWSAIWRSSQRALMLTPCLSVSLRLQYWAHWTCVVFYVVCKAVVYALFVEKAFLANKFMYKVRTCRFPGASRHRFLTTARCCCYNHQGPRFGHPLFRRLVAMWCVYSVLFVLLCFNAIAEYTPLRTINGTLPKPGPLDNATLLDGFCTFYVKPLASIPIVVYDLIFTSTLVYWFVKPLIEARKNSPNESDSRDWRRKTTEKALIGAQITLLASFLNIMSLVLFPMVRQSGCATQPCSRAPCSVCSVPR